MRAAFFRAQFQHLLSFGRRIRRCVRNRGEDGERVCSLLVIAGRYDNPGACGGWGSRSFETKARIPAYDDGRLATEVNTTMTSAVVEAAPKPEPMGSCKVLISLLPEFVLLHCRRPVSTPVYGSKSSRTVFRSIRCSQNTPQSLRLWAGVFSLENLVRQIAPH